MNGGRKHFPTKSSSDNLLWNKPADATNIPPISTNNNNNLQGISIVDTMRKNKKEMNNVNRIIKLKRNRSMENKREEIIKEQIAKPLEPYAKYRKRREYISCLFPDDYYKKFINKPSKNSTYNNSKSNITKKDNLQVTYEIVNNKDQNLIDTQDIKASFNRNGIVLYNISSLTSGLNCNTKDKISISFREEDIEKPKFKRLKDSLEKKGLEMNKVTKEMYTKKNVGVFPAKYNWKTPIIRRNNSVEQPRSFNRKKL